MAFLTTQNWANSFLTGKGGVGKTSMSCATGLALAETGKKVLIVSTDPASNLDEVLGVALGQQPAPNSVTVPGLCAMNIDPEAAARAYRERMVASLTGAFFRMRPSTVWKNSFPVPVPWRSRLLTNFQSFWAIRPSRRISTMSSLIRLRPDTPCVC